MPRPSGAPPRRRPARAGSRTASAAAAVGLAGSGDPQLLLDPRDRAVLRIEEVRADLVPAAEPVNFEQARRGGEVLLVVELLQDRAVALGLVDPLRLLGEEKVTE